ncbi:MAG: hypothetical protein RML40_01495 [Bacteroidota bacterium]|nr:hypothetical protein [Candidatus Kapabacteria bacterium]MDW8219182.1 hypothetical protein [Bacteroidota bacterium]
MDTGIFASIVTRRSTQRDLALHYVLALTVLFLVSLAVLTATMYAQPAHSTTQRPSAQDLAERRINRLQKVLRLNDEQVRSIQPIITRSIEAHQKIRKELKGQHNAIREAIRANIEATDKEIRDILTPEQQTKFDLIRRRIGERHNERMQDRKQ